MELLGPKDLLSPMRPLDSMEPRGPMRTLITIAPLGPMELLGPILPSDPMETPSTMTNETPDSNESLSQLIP